MSPNNEYWIHKFMEKNPRTKVLYGRISQLCLIITRSSRYCRKIKFTVFYVRNQILNHTMIFMNIYSKKCISGRFPVVKFLSFSQALPCRNSWSRKFYYRSTFEPIGRNLWKLGFVFPWIRCIRLGNLWGEMWLPDLI